MPSDSEPKPPPAAEPEAAEPEPLPPDRLRTALDVAGLDFAEEELTLAGPRVAKHRQGYERLRAIPVPWDLAPALRFEPRIPGIVGRPARVGAGQLALPDARRPDSLEELAFASIPQLAALIRARLVSCVELATLALDRLARVDPLLHCVVTATTDRALAQARAFDEELAGGHWRGPLHGIPWGAKDLLAVRGYPTTWGTPWMLAIVMLPCG